MFFWIPNKQTDTNISVATAKEKTIMIYDIQNEVDDISGHKIGLIQDEKRTEERWWEGRDDEKKGEREMKSR